MTTPQPKHAHNHSHNHLFLLTTIFLLIITHLSAPVSAGAPEERDIKFIVQAGHSRSIELDHGSKYLELSLTIPKHALSFGLSDNIEVEDHIEGAPITAHSGTAELHITLEQEQGDEEDDEGDDVTASTSSLSTSSGASGSGNGNWSLLEEISAFNFSDSGVSKFVSVSLSGVSGYKKGLRHRVAFTTNASVPVIVSAEVVTMSGYGKAQGWLGLVVLVIAYGIISFELAERALIGLAAVFVTLVLLVAGNKTYTLSLEYVATWLDQSTFVLLFGMMIIVQVFGETGFFEWLAVQCIRLSKGSIRVLFILICTMTAVLSAFLDNVTTVLLSSPITIKICEVLEISPVPFLIGQALLSNIGGAATLVGDPPNIIIGSMLKEYVSFVSFIENLSIPVILASVAAMAFLLVWWRASIAGRRQVDLSEIIAGAKIKDMRKFVKSCIVLCAVLLFFFLSSVLHIEPAWIALAGATAIMLLTYPKHIETPLTGVEWNTLVFFAALFVLINGMAELGIIRMICSLISAALKGVDPKYQEMVAITMILWFAGLISAVISSIPTTTTFVPVLKELVADPRLNLRMEPLIWSLSLGACFGGNGTLVGAAANVVVAGIVRSKGYFITFASFTKVGFFVMLISLVIANAYLLIVFGAINKI